MEVPLTCWPHFGQNVASAETSAPQAEQSMRRYSPGTRIWTTGYSPIRSDYRLLCRPAPGSIVVWHSAGLDAKGDSIMAKKRGSKKRQKEAGRQKAEKGREVREEKREHHEERRESQEETRQSNEELRK